MLDKPGDLIPVSAEAANLPWTKRRRDILSYLHRGAVDFDTLVYDTNVGEISTLSFYFNPQRCSVEKLNTEYGQYVGDGPADRRRTHQPGGSVTPRLLLYPHHRLNPAARAWVGPSREDGLKAFRKPFSKTCWAPPLPTEEELMELRCKAVSSLWGSDLGPSAPSPWGRAGSSGGDSLATDLSLDALCLEAAGVDPIGPPRPLAAHCVAATEPNSTELAIALETINRAFGTWTD